MSEGIQFGNIGGNLTAATIVGRDNTQTYVLLAAPPIVPKLSTDEATEQAKTAVADIQRSVAEKDVEKTAISFKRLGEAFGSKLDGVLAEYLSKWLIGD
jgi:hypothetical protein